MFNMTKIGKTIALLRKEQNMTQLELADRLGISYQAVSNWERGNSMPDISKLPELAEIFDISLDDLIGEKSELVTAAANDKLVECMTQSDISAEELSDALPLLKPSQVTTIIKDSDYLKSEKHKDQITMFLPFMAESDVREFAFTAFEKEQPVKKFLPFLSETDVLELAGKVYAREQSVKDFLPFLSKDSVKDFAEKALESGQSIKNYLPFLSKDYVKELAKKTFESGQSIKPFLPFLHKDDVAKLAAKAAESGQSIKYFLPFMDERYIKEFASNLFQKK